MINQGQVIFTLIYMDIMFAYQNLGVLCCGWDSMIERQYIC